MNTKSHLLTLALLATLGLSGSALAQVAPPPPAAGSLPDPAQAPPPAPPVPPLPPTSTDDTAVPPAPNTPDAPMPPAPPEAPMPPPAPDAPPPPAAMPPMPPAPMGSDTGTMGSTTAPDTNAAASGGAQVTSQPGNSISSNYHVDFDAMDGNHDGNISRSEAKGNADLTREFRVVDSNHNGRLSKEEMKGWLD